MNAETKLILENQQAIMNVINWIMVRTCSTGSGELQRDIIIAYEKTREAINPPTNNLKEERAKGMKECEHKYLEKYNYCSKCGKRATQSEVKE